MSYHLLAYAGIFLPIVILLYSLTPQKFRWITMLIADYVFFCMLSGKLVIYLIIATIFTYYVGNLIEKVEAKAKEEKKSRKVITRRKRYVLATGIILNIILLFLLKYINVWYELKWAVPIGISYYTLQIISYLTDIYRGTQKAEKKIAKVALYLSFFPIIMQGPITRFSQIAEDLYVAKNITYKNLTFGYQRIMWGLFKKMLVADRLHIGANYAFNLYFKYDGTSLAVGVLFFTMMLYSEFSGTVDIIIGSAEIFGVTLPENFRQPFFAKDAGDIWARWHITLGAFLKDYVFYSISLAKPVKNITKFVKKIFGRSVSSFVGPTIALFFVWLCNGIWHGPYENYLFYGMFYFVLIFIENITEKPIIKLWEFLGVDRNGWLVKILRFIKIFFIVNIGEMFFRANSIADGFAIGKKILEQLDPTMTTLMKVSIGVDHYDTLMALVGMSIIFIVDCIHEKGIKIRESIASMKLPIRWAIIYACIFFIIIFAAYGPGYSPLDALYAKY